MEGFKNVKGELVLDEIPVSKRIIAHIVSATYFLISR